MSTQIALAVEVERLRRAEGHALSVVRAQQETIERLRAELICVCNLLAHRGRHAEDGKYCKICEVVARARKIAAAREGESEGEEA